MATTHDTEYAEYIARRAEKAAVAAALLAREEALAEEGAVLLDNGRVIREAAYMPDERRATGMLRAGLITRDEYVAQHGPVTITR